MKSILVIEDEPQQVWAYQVKLGKSYEIDTAGNVDNALAKLQQKEFDLIILDIMLPGGVNGFDFLKKIKSNPKTAGVPVMVVTNLDEDCRQTAMDLGAIDYVIKVGSSLEELSERIKQYLGEEKK